MQLPLWKPSITWTPPQEFPDLRRAPVIAVDTETRDPFIKQYGPGWAYNQGEIVGISVATEFFKGYYPIAHQGGGNMDSVAVFNWLKDQLKTDTPKVFCYAQYDVGWLRRHGVEVKGLPYDITTAEALLNENRTSYSLDTISTFHTGKGKDESKLREAAQAFGVDPKSGLWKLHAGYVGEYAEVDAVRTLETWKIQEPLLKMEDLWDLFLLETKLIPMAIDMRWRGVRVDLDRAEQISKTWRIKEAELLQEIHNQCGLRIDPWAGKDLSIAFEQMDIEIEIPKTDSGNDSFKGDWLEDIAEQVPFASLVHRYRKINKARRDYIDTHILEFAGGSVGNGRLHFSTNLLKGDDGGTVSGRISIADPPLQQFPSVEKDPEIGGGIRGCCLPEEGEFWGQLDYSSQEPRLTVHYAGLMNLPGARDAVARYNENPRTDYHQMVADMAGIPRKAAKTINLGLAYGMGGPKLCHKLGLPTRWIWRNPETQRWEESEKGRGIEVAGPEGESLIKQYHQNVPFIQGLMDACGRVAADRGYIVTIGGRRCRFDFWEASRAKGAPQRYDLALARTQKRGDPWYGQVLRRAYTHKALNRLIQGSAADQTKKAMLWMYEEGILPLIQMHDELDVSVGDRRTLELAQRIMIEAVPLSVPTVVDVECGRDWGHAGAADSWSMEEVPWPMAA